MKCIGLIINIILFNGISLVHCLEYLYSIFDYLGDVPVPITVERYNVGTKMRCFSICLQTNSCYLFDYCRNHHSKTCYLYDKNTTTSNTFNGGPCRRYKLRQLCEKGFTNPCRCPDNVGEERCRYRYDCDGRLVPLNKPSYTYSRTFSDGNPRDILCNMTTDNGGWIVFQRRFDGSTDFYRNWTEYALGFGNITSEFYLGNQIIHEIVREGIFELRIELEDKAGELRYAKYGQFSIGSPDSLYILHVTDYSGNAGNSLKYHNGRNFTTFDMDNDIWPENCAVRCHGAWWYGGCQQSNLNGGHGNDEHAKGINWFHWHGWYYSMNSTQMMFRVTKH